MTITYADIVLQVWGDAREDEGTASQPERTVSRFRTYLACLEDVLGFEVDGGGGGGPGGGEPMPEPEQDPADVVTPFRQAS